jgi:hypothetical protein
MERARFGFEARALHSIADAEDEALDGAALLARAGAFPFIWLNISFAEGALAADELGALEAELALVRYA